MNKTININLGGIFFHIDEIAYQKLKRYIDAIRKSLSDDPQGKDEIIKDIESRISELLSERVKDERQVINESDISEIIAIMGQPEDYTVDEELFNENLGRTYRKKNSSRKFYRDSDDKFLGGVSSGMAHYFGIDTIWIRIAWLIAAFGFGFGFLVYPILWILLPEAKTTSEKLEMEGEPVNITNIERKIRAEFEDVSDRVKEAAGEVSDAVKDGYDNVSDSLKKKNLRQKNQRAKSGIQDILDVLGRVIAAIFMVIGKFIGVLLIIISVATMIGLVIGLFTAGAAEYIGTDSFFGSGIQFENVMDVPVWIISILVLLLVGIPFLMLFFLGLFILSSKSKVLNRTAKYVLLGLWILALLSSIFIGLKQAKALAYDGYTIENSAINVMPLDTLSIKMIDNEILSEYNTLSHRDNYNKVMDNNGVVQYYSNDIRVNIRKSDSTEAYVKIKKEALGSSRKVARTNAKAIEYSFQKNNNILNLNGYFLTDSKKAFRDLEVKLTLYIPENKVIYLDENMYSFLRNVNTIDDMYWGDLPGHYFKMTASGLECLDCTNTKSDDDSDDDFWKDEASETEKDGLNLKINEDGVQVKIKDGDKKAEVILDENGIEIDKTSN